MSRLNFAVAFSIASLSMMAPRLAEAHYKLVAPTNWWTQASEGSPQKAVPCGNVNESTISAGTTATGVVNVYQSGQPVTVTVTATVQHPGWWRISLREGAASTQTSSTFPDPPELGAPNSLLQCTPPFIDNPVWSPTQPVIADKLGLPAAATATDAMATIQSGTQNYQVTIPAAAHCSMATPCTLQVLMIMTDHTFPSCNYHHCANMALAGSATGTGGMTGTADAGAHDGGTGGKTGAGGAPATGTGGAPVTGTGGAPSTGAGGSTTAGTGGSTTGAGGAMAGEGGSSGGGQDSGTGGTTGSDNGCSCAVGSGVAGSSNGLLVVALLALRRRRKK